MNCFHQGKWPHALWFPKMWVCWKCYESVIIITIKQFWKSYSNYKSFLIIINLGHLRLVFDFGFERQEIIIKNENFALGQHHDLTIQREDQGSKITITVSKQYFLEFSNGNEISFYFLLYSLLLLLLCRLITMSQLSTPSILTKKLILSLIG